MSEAGRIRRGGPGDVAAASALLGRCLAEAWSEDELARTLVETGGRLLLLEEEELAGVITLRVEAGEAEVLQVAVDPARRRRGLGRLLLRAGEAAAIEAGAGRCFLEVRESNASARRLYEKAGYELVGRRRGYYRDGEDALVLARSLAAPPLGEA